MNSLNDNVHKPNSDIRVRFAPSPTGEIHIGNLRSVIFNWIFARKNHGKLFLRIEDTHEERCLKSHEELILTMTSWLGIDFDNCFDDDIIKSKGFLDYDNNIFIKQSYYKPKYQSYAHELHSKGFTYYCTCDTIDTRCHKCRNSDNNNGVLRFKTPDNLHIEHKDMVFGIQVYNSNSIEDFALLRSNGDPTYMLCVVVDDNLMEISHVIRGEDHRTNTFKQILLYNAFNWNIPQFAHLPMVLDSLGKKLSKRNGDSNSELHKISGIVPEALFNILLRLGWGYKNEEIISKSRILEIFEMNQIRKSPTMFDVKKLHSFSGKYLRMFDYRNSVIAFIETYCEPVNNWQKEAIFMMYDDVAKRVCTFREFYEYVQFLFSWKNDHKFHNLNVINGLKLLNVWNYDAIKSTIQMSLNDPEEFKQILGELRLCLTNSPVSIDVVKIIESIGKQCTLDRLGN
jgi:glutamyl/glutaminyl-tRNA synthetase